MPAAALEGSPRGRDRRSGLPRLSRAVPSTSCPTARKPSPPLRGEAFTARGPGCPAATRSWCRGSRARARGAVPAPLREDRTPEPRGTAPPRAGGPARAAHRGAEPYAPALRDVRRRARPRSAKPARRGGRQRDPARSAAPTTQGPRPTSSVLRSCPRRMARWSSSSSTSRASGSASRNRSSAPKADLADSCGRPRRRPSRAIPPAWFDLRLPGCDGEWDRDRLAQVTTNHLANACEHPSRAPSSRSPSTRARRTRWCRSTRISLADRAGDPPVAL